MFAQIEKYHKINPFLFQRRQLNHTVTDSFLDFLYGYNFWLISTYLMRFLLLFLFTKSTVKMLF